MHSPITVVNRITKTGRIDNGQRQIDAILLEQHLGGLHGDRFLDTMRRSRILVLVVDIRQKHRVDQRRFAQTTFANHHQGELEPFLDRLPVHLVRQTGESHISIDLLHLGAWRRRDGQRLFDTIVSIAAGQLIGVLLIETAGASSGLRCAVVNFVMLLLFENEVIQTVGDSGGRRV